MRRFGVGAYSYAQHSVLHPLRDIPFDVPWKIILDEKTPSLYFFSDGSFEEEPFFCRIRHVLQSEF